MELAVDERDLHVDHRVAAEDALRHRLHDALLDRGDELLRDRRRRRSCPRTRSPRRGGAARSRCCRPRTGRGRRSASRDGRPRPPCRGSSRGRRSSPGRCSTSTPNFASGGSIMHVEVRLAHAVDHGLVGLLVAGDAERGVLLAQPRETGRELVLVALRLRRDRVGEQRLGQLDRRSCTGSSFVRPGVAGVRVRWSFATAPMSPAATSGIDSCSLPRCVKSWPRRSSVACVAL